MSKFRVVHWGTGATGKFALRYILQHPDLELVGLIVASERNLGKDAGEIVGLPATGIIAQPISAAAALAALKPDALCYCGDAAQRPETEAAREAAIFLEAGVNVSTYVLISLHDPEFAPVETRRIVEEACSKGNSSFLQGGADPGFSSVTLLHAALSVAGRVDKVQVTEFGNLIHYDVPAISRNNMGFGMPADYIPPRFQDGRVQNWWKRGVLSIARLLGHTPDDVRFVFDTALATHDIQTSFGIVEKGTIGGTYWRLDGVVSDRVVATIQHVTRLSPDFTKPDWPDAPGELRQGSIYEVAVSGDLNYTTCAFFNQPVPEYDTDVAIVITGSHTVNAIPSVCKAKPGIIPPEDVPPFIGGHSGVACNGAVGSASEVGILP